ncbi:MAG: DUF1570 domain-containing protein [Planctomycetota bacterium]
MQTVLVAVRRCSHPRIGSLVASALLFLVVAVPSTAQRSRGGAEAELETTTDAGLSELYRGLIWDVKKREWIDRNEATECEMFWYVDRWLPKTFEKKAKGWARFDERVNGWADAYEEKVGAYRVETDLPRHIFELDIRPFLLACFDTYVDTFRRTFGLRGAAVKNKGLKLYRNFDEYSRFNNNRPRSNPAFIVGGQTLFCYYDETDPDQFYGSFFHEGAHQFVKGLLPGVDFPIWLDEGLATFYEGCKYSRSSRQVQVGVASAERLTFAKRSLQQFVEGKDEDGNWIVRELSSGKSLARFLFMDVPRGRFSAREYALAWSFIHFLVHREDGRYRATFGRFLRESNGAGIKTLDEVWDEVCRTPLRDLEAGWVEYVMDMEPEHTSSWATLSGPGLRELQLERGLIIYSVDGVPVWDGKHFRQLWRGRDKSREIELVCVRENGVDQRQFVRATIPANADPRIDATGSITRGYYLID